MLGKFSNCLNFGIFTRSLAALLDLKDFKILSNDFGNSSLKNFATNSQTFVVRISLNFKRPSLLNNALVWLFYFAFSIILIDFFWFKIILSIPLFFESPHVTIEYSRCGLTIAA